MTAHAQLSPSASKRWLNCPGSMILNADLPDTPNDYTHIGSIAHELAEVCLKKKADAAQYLGWFGFVNDKGGSGVMKELGVNADKVFTHQIDQDMVDAVQVYLDVIRADVAEMVSPILKIEERVSMDAWAPGMFGTADFIAIEEFGLMRVYDYKNGRTIVEVEDNTQAQCYGLGALGKNPFAVDEIELVIVQPNAPHSDGVVRRWRLTPEELYRWGETELAAGAKRVENGDTRLKVGDWCQFCSAKREGVCPEIRRQMFGVIDVETDSADLPVKATPTLPDPMMLTPDQVARVLELEPLFTSWLKDVKDKALEDAKLGRGTPPGFKLVPGRASRRWSDDQAVAAALYQYGNAIYDTKLKSPAQMEKMIKTDGGDPAAELHGLVQVSRGVMLAPESDKRKAIEPMFT